MWNNSTLKVLIFTRDHTNNQEEFTIYARITEDGRRAKINLKRYTSVTVWDVSKEELLELPKELEYSIVIWTRYLCK